MKRSSTGVVACLVIACVATACARPTLSVSPIRSKIREGLALRTTTAAVTAEGQE